MLRNFTDELSPADKAYSFRLEYIAGKNRRVVIGNSINLAEAYSLAKDGWITLWADPDVPHEPTPRGSKRSYSDALPSNCSTNGTRA